MPTQNWLLPSYTTYNSVSYFVSGVKRNRVWANTVNWAAYQDAKPWELPVNNYTDSQLRYLISDFAKQRVYYPGYEGGSIERAWGYTTEDQSNAAAVPGHDWCRSYLPSEGELRNQALISNLLKAKDISVNLPVAAAEMKKTGGMIVGAAKSLFQAYRQFHRGDFAGAARTLNITVPRLHKRWLEYAYGWAPLVSEVKGAAEEVAKRHFPRPPIFRIQTRKPAETELLSRTTTNRYGWQGSGKATVEEMGVASREVKIIVWYQVRNSQFEQASRLGLTDLASVVWETTPYSFLFDYLIGIGDWLGALSAAHDLIVLRGIKTVEEDSTYTRIVSEPQYSSSGFTYGSFSTTNESKKRDFQRSPQVIGASEIYPPVKTDPFNLKRVVNVVALYRGLVTSMPRNARL